MQRNEKLAEAIAQLWKNCPGVSSIEIEVEMPLNSGLQLIANGVFGDDKRGIRIKNAGAFYAALKDDSSHGIWNRMHILVASAESFEVSSSFDERLRMETFEQVK